MPLPEFSFSLDLPDPPEVVWARFWDLQRHTSAVPLTKVSGRARGVDDEFTGRTALGPWVLDDVMVIRAWDPPRQARLDKVGGVLAGQVEVVISPTAGGCRLRWRQTYGAHGIPDRITRALSPVLGLALRAGYRRTVRRVVAAG